MAKKQICKYSENKLRLEKLLVLRSVDKTDKYDKEIQSLKNDVDFFEYGIITKL